MGLKLKVGVATDKGLVRERNEDAAAVDGWLLQHDHGAPTEMVLDDSRVHRLAVCDGMGGHLGGATASLMAAQELTRIDGPEVPDHVNQVSARLVAAGREDPALFGMGTTAVLLETSPDGRGSVFHVGDSRAYLADPELIRLTSDDRSSAHLPLLTQALGGNDPRPLDVHRYGLSLHTGQRLLLCSDGLVDMVSDGEIETILARPDAPAALVGAAKRAGGQDNVTVVVVEVLDSPVERISPDDLHL